MRISQGPSVPCFGSILPRFVCVNGLSSLLLVVLLLQAWKLDLLVRHSSVAAAALS